MELIASSRIVKAQAAARAATPYTRELTNAVSNLASGYDLDHPLLQEAENPTRAALLVITSDRGLAGAYSANALKLGEQVRQHLEEQGMEVELYISGQKGVAYHEFREREIAQSWTGFSESPRAKDGKAISDVLIDRFLTPTSEGGVDEIHFVTTSFQSMMKQTPIARRILPLQYEDEEDPALESTESKGNGSKGNGNGHPDDDDRLFYEFEPDPKTVLNALLPLFVSNRIFTALLQASASELASRQQAMKAATDNAQELIGLLTREENQARQAEITQEITEIVGGAAALSESA